MAEINTLLRPEERIALQKQAEKTDIDGQRAAALVAIDDGETQVSAAETSGLSVNQVRYIVNKFKSERLLAFPDALSLLPTDEESIEVTREEIPAAKAKGSQLNHLLAEIDGLVNELRSTLPDAGQYPYSPLKLLTLVRDTAARYAPDAQLSLLEPFEDMTREDLVDPDTWKGIAYMIAYSAQFQAAQAKGMLDDRLPDPFKPETVIQTMRGGLDRFTPDVAREMAANLEGTSREDILDPATWKGLAYVFASSAQFQAGRTRDKLNEQLPDPFKPDTLWGMLVSGLDRIAPETAKEILSSFEGATKEDLLDPDTWKGVWYMLNYSLQFQAEQMMQRLGGESKDVEEAE